MIISYFYKEIKEKSHNTPKQFLRADGFFSSALLCTVLTDKLEFVDYIGVPTSIKLPSKS